MYWQGGLDSAPTARIERAYSYRARSASMGDDPGCLATSRRNGKACWLSPAGFFVTRQRPTFPLPHSSSIIGLGGLNFRVRDGNGCGPSGKATGNFLRVLSSKFWVVSYHSALARFCARQTMSIRSKDDDVKPHDRLVLVSYSPHGPSTPSLSNS